jgi:integrase
MRAGRKPSVRFYPSRNGYYVTVNGRTHRLADGPDDAPEGKQFKMALDRFREILEVAFSDEAGDENPLRVCAERYLDNLSDMLEHDQRAARTYAIRQKYLAILCNYPANGGLLGEKRIGALRPQDIRQAIQELRAERTVRCGVRRKDGTQTHRRTRWTDGTVRLALMSLNACLNWCVREGIAKSNPCRKIELPAPRARAEDCILSDADKVRVRSCCRRRRTLELCICLEQTGARPGELFAARVGQFQPEDGCIVIPAKERARNGEKTHKTGRKTHRDRVIILTGEALEIVRRACGGRGPEEPIFLSPHGKPWGHSYYVAFRKLAAKAELPNFSAYSYRHTFAVEWLERGGDVDTLAALLGTSRKMIEDHYGHRLSRKGNLRAQVLRLMGEGRADTLPADPAVNGETKTAGSAQEGPKE